MTWGVPSGRTLAMRQPRPAPTNSLTASGSGSISGGTTARRSGEPSSFVLSPADLVEPDRVLEAPERDLPQVRKQEPLARRQLAHHVRRDDLARFSVGADPRRPLPGGPPQGLRPSPPPPPR